MKNPKSLCLLLLLCVMSVILHTRVEAQELPPRKFDAEFTNFFLGNWEGSGQFSNGNKIQAHVSFSYFLDSSWIEYIHKDLPPNNFMSKAFWGFDHTG